MIRDEGALKSVLHTYVCFREPFVRQHCFRSITPKRGARRRSVILPPDSDLGLGPLYVWDLEMFPFP